MTHPAVSCEPGMRCGRIYTERYVKATAGEFPAE